MYLESYSTKYTSMYQVEPAVEEPVVEEPIELHTK